MSAMQQNPDGRWVPLEPMPEPFGVLWGRLWHARRRDGQPKWGGLVTSWLDARAITRTASARTSAERSSPASSSAGSSRSGRETK